MFARPYYKAADQKKKTRTPGRRFDPGFVLVRMAGIEPAFSARFPGASMPLGNIRINRGCYASQPLRVQFSVMPQDVAILTLNS